MFGLSEIKKDIKNKKFSNCYVFVGQDEGLIKSSIEDLKNSCLNKGFNDLNFMEFDGRKMESINDVINACETLPLLSPYRMVLIYRASFLETSEDVKNKKILDSLVKYIPEMSDQTILVIYTLLYSKRDKPSSKINKFTKISKVIEAKYDSKERKAATLNYIESLIKKGGKSINKAELELLFETYKNSDSMFIKNEMDKLLSFAPDNVILKEYIKAICFKNSDDDIFDLVDFIQNKKFSDALGVVNDLIYKGEKPESILFFIERQFRLLFIMKFASLENKSLEYISKGLNLNIYVCKSMLFQSNRFDKFKLQKAIEICLDSEKKFKSESIDKLAQLELLIINLMSVS